MSSSVVSQRDTLALWLELSPETFVGSASFGVMRRRMPEEGAQLARIECPGRVGMPRWFSIVGLCVFLGAAPSYSGQSVQRAPAPVTLAAVSRQCVRSTAPIRGDGACMFQYRK